MDTPTTTGFTQADVTVDVSGSCAVGGSLSIAATIFLPPPDALGDDVTLVVVSRNA